MLPEGHKPVCRSCYNLECETCADKVLAERGQKTMFTKCECGCYTPVKENKMIVPKVHIIDVTTNAGVPLRAKLTVDPEPGKTKISFYDRRFDYTPDGQITGAVYYADSLAQIPYGTGLTLHGAVPAWGIDGPTFSIITDWLNRQIDAGVWMV